MTRWGIRPALARTVRLTALLALLLIAAPAAQASTNRADAARKAVRALAAGRSDGAVVFGLRQSIAPRTVITEAGPGAPLTARGRLARADVQLMRTRRVLAAGRERAWFFYEDRGVYQAFEHPGRVVLVGARTGHVQISRQIDWMPLVAGREPAFFRSAAAYAGARYRVSAPARAAAARRPSARAAQATTATRRAVADALAQEHACALNVSDTLGRFDDYGSANRTRARVTRFFDGLAALNRGFASWRYATGTGVSPIAYAQRLLDSTGCRGLFLYAAGGGPRDGEPAVNVGLRPFGRTAIQWQDLSARDLQRLVRANPTVTFRLLLDAGHAVRLAQRLAGEPNVVVLLTSGTPGSEPAVVSMPHLIVGDGMLLAAPAPTRLRELTNVVFKGLEDFTADPAELGQALTARAAAGGPSVMSFMLARALGLTPLAFGGGEPVPAPAPPIVDAPSNRAPRLTTGPQSTQQPHPVSFTLTATDPDGDVLSYTVTGQPGHGTLTGTAPELTYTPEPGFRGTDFISYEVSDGRGGVTQGAVEITVRPDNRPPVITASPGSAAFSENGPPVAVDPGLTLGSPSDSDLSGATVTISSGLRLGDELLFGDQNGITGSYDAATGVLTLTGRATLSQYQDALRSVRFDTASDDPGTSRTITFVASGNSGGSSDPVTRTLSIAAVNDAPAAAINASTPLAYHRGDPATPLAPSLTVSDPDSAQLAGATVRFTDNFRPAEDVLAFSDQNGITGTWDAGTGVLSLTGAASVAAYQGALRSITYRDTAPSHPDTTPRTVAVVVDDGAADNHLSAPASRDIQPGPPNSTPVVTTSPGSAAFVEDTSGPVAVDPSLTVSDDDDTELDAASVAVTAGYDSARDRLNFADQNGITGSWDPSTGILSLTGTATVAQYAQALRSVTFSTAGDTPSAATRAVRFRVDDGGANGISSGVTRDVTVTPVNDAPVLGGSAGSITYTENDPATVVYGTLTVSDPDSASLTGATVRISAGFASGQDVLEFSNQNGITGTYDAATGVLTLSGSATPTQYGSALSSVRYRNSSEDPSTAQRTVSFQVDDGASANHASNTLSRAINVASVNDAPVVTPSGASNTFTEGGSPAPIDDQLGVSDADSPNLTGATVSIGTGFHSGDVLGFVNTAQITGTYDSTTGVLELAGTTTVANYRAALRSITFSTGNNPNEATRTVSFRVGDGTAASNLAPVDVHVVAVNDRPVVTTTSGSTPATEGATDVEVDNGLTVADTDTPNLVGATVSLGSPQSGDVLLFSNTSNITGQYDAGTGVLTLTGTDTVANYQTALRSVSFRTTNDAPNTSKTASFQVDDGQSTNNLSAVATKGIAVTPVNDAPTVTTSSGTASFTEGGSAVAPDAAVTVTDPDSAMLAGATVSISAGRHTGDELSFANTSSITGVYDATTGVLTLTGADTPSNYQAALRSVTFDSTSNAPGTSRTISFQADDGAAANNLSNIATRDIAVTAVNSAPAVTTTGGSTAVTEGGSDAAVDTGITVSDADSADLTGATVSVTGNRQSGDVLKFTNTASITGTYDTGTGVLTLTGTDSVANYQAALRAVSFRTTNDDPSASKTVSFQVDDGQSTDNLSNTATKGVSVTAVNDAPTITTSSGTTAFGEGGSAVAIDPALTATDPDSPDLTGATVSITSGLHADDVLSFADTSSITGSYDSGTGVLTLTGTDSVANYQAALRSVKFQSPSASPGASRTISFQASDGTDSSTTATKGISITENNSAPVVTTTSGATSYTEGGTSTAVDGGLTVTDADTANLAGATVSISSSFQSGDDLVFVNTASISGAYNPGTGVLTLTGSAPVADYQAALRTIEFSTANDAPSTSKTISFVVDDGEAVDHLSATATKDIAVTPVNDAPTVTTSSGTASFTENGAATAVDPGAGVADPDSVTLGGATVTISAGRHAGDILGFTNTTAITSAYDTATGVLTLTGTASLTEYRDALRSVTFSSTSDAPGTSRTISLQVDDGSALNNLSNTATRGITLTEVNDAPVVTATSGTTSYTEDGPTVPADGAVTVTDVDSSSLTGATVSISANKSAGDVLSFTNTANITGSYSSSSGVLTLSGTDTVANYQAALRAVSYSTTSDDPSTATRTISFQADDGQAQNHASNVATRDLGVTRSNDAPVANTDAFGDALANTRFAVGTTTTGPNISKTGSTVLGNDTDPDTPQSSLTVTAADVRSANQCASPCPTNVHINSDGSFVYDPPQGYTGHDSFTYTTHDNDTEAPADRSSAPATVDINVVGPVVWYVNGAASSPAAGTGGTSNAPFNSLAALRSGGSADAKDGSGDIIFLYGNASAYSGGIDLETNQQLIGEPQGLTVDPNGPSTSVNLVPAGGSNPKIANATGNGITLANGNTIRRIDVDSTSGPGISGTAVTTGDIGPNTNITNTTGPAVQLLGAAGGDVTIGSTINTAGRPARVENRSSGTVTFSGTLSGGGTGGGIRLDSNTGATIDLQNTLTLSTAANTALQATNGGTVKAGATGSTLATSTGTALNVQNTTIGTGGLKFQSVSAGSSGNPANGIVLNNTGTTAGVTITGTGVVDSGGTIQNTTGSGISLTNTDKFSAARMKLSGTNHAGVNGVGVTDFTFTDGKILDAGDAKSDPKDSAFAFNTTTTNAADDNVDGAVTIDRNTLSGHYGAGVDIQQDAGTISNLLVRNNTISDSAGVTATNDAIQVFDFGESASVASVTDGAIQNNTITGHPTGSAIFFGGGNSTSPGAPAGTYGTAANTIEISGNRINPNPGTDTVKVGQFGIGASIEGKGSGAFDIINNGTSAEPLRNIKGQGIGFGGAGNVDVTYKVDNNFLVQNNVNVGSGSDSIGAGPDAQILGDGSTLRNLTLKAAITNNTTSSYDGDGIRVLNGNHDGRVDVRIQNNNVGAPAHGPNAPIELINGSTGDPSRNPKICTTLSGNSTSAGPADGFGDTRPGILIFEFDLGPSAFSDFVGLTPSSGATPTQTELYLTAQNPNSSLGGGFYAGKKVAVDDNHTRDACTHPSGMP